MSESNSSNDLFEYTLSVLPESNTEKIIGVDIGVCCFCKDECNPASQTCGPCARNPPIEVLENIIANTERHRRKHL